MPYHMRFQIDTGVRCGLWYDMRAKVTTCDSTESRTFDQGWNCRLLTNTLAWSYSCQMPGFSIKNPFPCIKSCRALRSACLHLIEEHGFRVSGRQGELGGAARSAAESRAAHLRV